MRPRTIQFLSKTPVHPYGTTQLRCTQPAEYLRSQGWAASVGCIYRTLSKRTSVLVLHSAVLDEYTAPIIRFARARGAILIYDIDDFLFDDRISGSTAASYREAMSMCDVVMVSTEFLAENARQFHPDVRVMPNGLSEAFIRRAHARKNIHGSRSQSTVTVAYLSGSKSHGRDFALIERSLIELLETTPRARVLLAGKIGFSDDFLRFGDRFEYRAFVPYEEFQKIFQKVDINLVPLQVDDPFSQGRSELKYIEAGGWAIPTIASPTQTYMRAIRHGENGLIVEGDKWSENLNYLVENDDARREIGTNSQHDVHKNYGPSAQERRWLETVTDVIETYGAKSRQRHNFITQNKCFAQACCKLIKRYAYRAKRELARSLGVKKGDSNTV